jgi:ribosomal protein S18 acetylase RimI-like enzyme
LVTLRPSLPGDLGFVTALERHPDNRDFIGQWSDAEHLAAMAGAQGRSHSIIEREDAPAGYLIAYDCRAQGAGIYVKRLLVADKERGTGKAALRAFLERAFERDRAELVWLLVRDWNARAQAVYRGLGFERFDPSPEAAMRFDAAAEAPGAQSFRMILRKATGSRCARLPRPARSAPGRVGRPGTRGSRPARRA